MIKLIASDLDDTLLDQNIRISAKNKLLIGQALSQGVAFTIATGRMFQSTVPFARELGLGADQPLICYNGALVKRLNGETLYHQPISPELGAAIAGHGQALGWTVNVYCDDQLYVGSWNEEVQEYTERVQVDVGVVGDLAQFIAEGNKEPSKILIIGPADGVQGRLEEVRRLGGGQIQIARSKEKLIEITADDVHKGKALLWLAEFMGLSAAEVLAIGDSDNDRTMLEAAGIGVAVANASLEVKRAADYQTLSNQEHGVAQAIKDFVLAAD